MRTESKENFDARDDLWNLLKTELELLTIFLQWENAAIYHHLLRILRFNSVTTDDLLRWVGWKRDHYLCFQESRSMVCCLSIRHQASPGVVAWLKWFEVYDARITTGNHRWDCKCYPTNTNDWYFEGERNASWDLHSSSPLSYKFAWSLLSGYVGRKAPGLEDRSYSCEEIWARSVSSARVGIDGIPVYRVIHSCLPGSQRAVPWIIGPKHARMEATMAVVILVKKPHSRSTYSFVLRRSCVSRVLWDRWKVRWYSKGSQRQLPW